MPVFQTAPDREVPVLVEIPGVLYPVTFGLGFSGRICKDALTVAALPIGGVEYGIFQRIQIVVKAKADLMIAEQIDARPPDTFRVGGMPARAGQTGDSAGSITGECESGIDRRRAHGILA